MNQQAFVLCRDIDPGYDGATPTAVYLDEALAEEEAARLNGGLKRPRWWVCEVPLRTPEQTST